MKLNLPDASELRKQVTFDREAKKQTLKNLVTNWLNTKVLLEIKKALDIDHNSIMLRIPYEAYRFEKEFYAEVQRQIEPLGYTSEKSHDGGGMYDTVLISWK